MRFALFREVPKRQHRKKRKLNNGAALRKGSDGSGDDDSDGSEDEQEPASASAERMVSPRAPVSRSSVGPARPPEDPIWGDESQDVQMSTEPPATVPSTSAGTGAIRPERYIIMRLAFSVTHLFIIQIATIPFPSG